MLVLADGEDVRDVIPSDPGIRYHYLGERAATVGLKRNIGVSLALGEVIAHWDDDDYSAPGRLEDQIRRMHETGKPVTGYNRMRFYDGSEWWEYRGMHDYALGTSLCYERSWWDGHRFPDLIVGEDNEFVFQARKLKAIVSVPAGEMMIATIHGGNTSPRSRNSKQWVKIET